MDTRNAIIHGVSMIFDGRAEVVSSSLSEFRVREQVPISDERFQEIGAPDMRALWWSFNTKEVINLRKMMRDVNKPLWFLATRDQPGRYEVVLDGMHVISYTIPKTTSPVGYLAESEVEDDTEYSATVDVLPRCASR